MSGIINKRTPFGKYLHLKLTEIDRTQAWLCKQPEINITPQTLTRMVRGERFYPDKEEVIKDFLSKYKHEEDKPS